MKRVLVVDDDPDIRELIIWKLKQAGFATLSASDGEEGLAAALAGDAEGRGPDVILVDWMMPKMPGIELCQALGENPATARVPIRPVNGQGPGCRGGPWIRDRCRRLHRHAVQPPGHDQPGAGVAGQVRAAGSGRRARFASKRLARLGPQFVQAGVEDVPKDQELGSHVLDEQAGLTAVALIGEKLEAQR